MATASSRRWSSVLSGGDDTVVAPASGVGIGALTVIRLSGEKVPVIAGTVCPDLDFDAGWRAQLVPIRDAGGVLERGVVTPYPAPRSYTGEDMMEITVHASPWLVEAVLAACEAAGARRAAPGEFTRRAVANGKLDLVQAEGVRDLIRAETAWQARLAREQISGTWSEQFIDLRRRMTALAADIEASLDFEEQGIVVSDDDLMRRRDAVVEALDGLAATVDAGREIRHGLRVAIMGPPNAGKSTLFNALVGRDRAIVAPEAGTTRDVVEATVDLEGVAVVYVDTAGIRTGAGSIEEEGIRRARRAGDGADMVLWLDPADDSGHHPPEEVEGRVVAVTSKADLRAGTDEGLRVSAHTGEGLEAVVERIRGFIGSVTGGIAGVAVNPRQAAGLRRAADLLRSADVAVREIAADDVRQAMTALDEVVGRVSSDDVLDQVFAGFCIGK
jgi:tRNA modification GTPase